MTREQKAFVVLVAICFLLFTLNLWIVNKSIKGIIKEADLEKTKFLEFCNFYHYNYAMLRLRITVLENRFEDEENKRIRKQFEERKERSKIDMIDKDNTSGLVIRSLE